MNAPPAPAGSAAPRPDPSRIALCYGGFFVVFVFTALLFAVREPFPVSLDELPQYSYVATEARAPALLPDYAAMQLVDPARPSHFGERPNYLNHPSAYYLLMSPILRLFPGTVLPLRLADTALAALAVALLFAAAARRFETMPQHAIFAGLVTGFPKLAVLAAIVNNDNLAFLGGAIVILGLIRDRGDLDTAAAIGSGLLIGAWAKLTAALMLGLLILAHCAPSLRAIPRRRLAVLLLLAIVGALPYIGNLVRYGSPLWEAGALAHGALPGTIRAPLAPLAFVRVFFATFPAAWAAIGASDPIDLAGAGAAVAIFLGSLPLGRLSRSVLIALLCTLAVNVGYEYLQQVRLGIWPGSYGANPRYYLPLWPGIAYGGAVAFGRVRPAWLAAAAATAVLVLFAYGFPLIAAIRYPLMH